MKGITCLGLFQPITLTHDVIRNGLTAFLLDHGIMKTTGYASYVSRLYPDMPLEIRGPSSWYEPRWHHDVQFIDHTLIVWSQSASTEVAQCWEAHSIGQWNHALDRDEVGPTRYHAFPHGMVVAIDNKRYVHRSPRTAYEIDNPSSQRWFVRTYLPPEGQP